ncbi:hypothetical protein POJ06DRAFT_7059 [Lipomyces tetrasporus]|uniref:pyridoxal 5'-phosphate synthase n=1 Tax=Lipomyces tetrasporus TaxID=54092 RepID=A0AAD7QYN0_9ASCO|nr:uncharacterized protein POJ06DRAFT_7059 [Lipomyces tetrasporus]KAJ8103785.1 hypothetical protein POJ06DRAFT_7059 [Lipomyces tetrasporus]
MNKERLIFAPATKQYTKYTLSRSSLDPSPLTQFNTWYGQAVESGEPLAESCTLATASLPSGRVSARVVLFKELDKRGFIVYSNWQTSKKAMHVKSNPRAAITFFWKNLERQVRVEGQTEFITPEESLAYFRTRPRESQIGAHASPQSQIVASREQLEKYVRETSEKFKDVEDIPLPDGWGGLRIVPDEVEFWQGRANRIHDRFSYTRDNEASQWKLERLAP